MTEALYRADDKIVALSELERSLDRLDALWVRHLAFLDQYQKAQGDIKKLFAAGYFSLTQANFKSLNRRSYGQDHYDERMKASRQCSIFGKDEDRQSTAFVVLHTGEPTQSARSEDKKAAAEPSQQPSPPSTPVEKSLDDAPAEHQEDPKTQDEQQGPYTGPTAASRDPLKWFGILVPRELRSTQTSFCSAVDGPIAAAANAARGMRETEAEIRKVRKAVKKAEKADVQ
ncbi:hypothetical protein LTR91_005286 [Friedmanniomyces endolithicus]|uniref:Vacuolar ATPase assembly protein VMA22 n=2 Tax=Friedmanniomyces endolithicus TaxID=329885 RepID=A0AAN6KTJ3_9PEZI|nr:hypothetical protein LTS09_013683 [Friedmanniomyces endolithicus]KAK0336213.1 hypothetical protein LTR94_009662 [Friedmanniomyces endolithicus]KAK0791512.1 hypothetical protein LTR59_008905 [Friedmanniomyces endolithicus]KAK0808252.1 hypothetical protein LTR75_006316 [Friedmanniomyces endolithicus]KAK0810467.1 hypothetical protein LTR38_003952 [Friedmanniomyces endolithicus]